MNNEKQIFLNEKKYFIPAYDRKKVVFVKGKGQYLWDINGKKYLDFFSGISVCSLGHCHPKVTKSIKFQADKLVHVSNLYYTLPQVKLAELLIKKSFKKGKVFFSNSGAEANECAIKLSRKLGSQFKKYEIISFKNSFHGRTLATLSATGQKKFHKGFAPLMSGFKFATFNDISSVKKLINKKTCAIIVEPVQCEGGVHLAEKKFLQGLRKLANKHSLLLIFDEIQCGMGRTGKLFAYQYYNVEPDVITLAKSVAGGLPLGVTIVKDKFANLFKPGDHGSTFGGNLVSCSSAIEVLNLIDKKMLNNITQLSEYTVYKLNELKCKYKSIKEIRAVGLIFGMELDREVKDIIDLCLREGLVIGSAGKKVLRFLPPFVITKRDVDYAIKILDKVFKVVL